MPIDPSIYMIFAVWLDKGDYVDYLLVLGCCKRLVQSVVFSFFIIVGYDKATYYLARVLYGTPDRSTVQKYPVLSQLCWLFLMSSPVEELLERTRQDSGRHSTTREHETTTT